MKKEKSTQKQNITPLTKQQEETITNGKQIKMDIHKPLKEDTPNSCFSQLMDKRKSKVQVSGEKLCPLPQSVI